MLLQIQTLEFAEQPFRFLYERELQLVFLCT